ncbi:MAG: gliding motility-associated C-terminal domain-containing protein [Flavobacteriales bacterium]|nr:gliding motility-associated C-terminal domain-containing protein [Flavobacteriales bacterium]
MNSITTLKGLALFTVFSLGMVAQTNAQETLIFNDGAMFFIGGELDISGDLGDHAVVWVDGTVVNNDSILVNDGLFIIKGDFINHAVSGGDGSIAEISANDGTFEVFGNWENNGEFYAGDGLVRFMATDTILGTEVTRFNNAELVGDIRRIQSDINAEISETGTLDLDSGEWATDESILTVLRPATGAITRETNCDPCGYVSSLGDGYLARATDQNVGYLFPVGSTLDASPDQHERYRPIILTPETNAADMFSVRFVNRNATINSLPVANVDPSICYVNPFWYHRINQIGGANATASLAHHALPSDPLGADEHYNTLANWGAVNGLWENVDNAGAGTVGPWNQVVRNGWNDFQNGAPEDAYIMAFKVPSEPEPQGLTAMCANVEETYTFPDNGSDYDFTVAGGTIVDQTTNTVTIIWDNQTLQSVTGSIVTIETVPNNINGGCASLPGTQEITIFSLPVADFSVAHQDTNLIPEDFFIYDILEMLDVSINTVNWSWDFDDGVTSSDSLPFHSYYNLGAYDIQLITETDMGCLDTLVVTVNVVEGIIIPNVFTPNNDGFNDVFDIRTSDVGEFNMEIYNRWGNMVYENTSPLISWDGRNMAGVQMPGGTYFFVISKAEMNSGNAIDNELSNYNFREKGWVTLIR